MKNKQIRVGIVGTGVGLRTHLPAFRAIETSEVVALSGRNIERATEFARLNGIEKALSTEELCTLPELDLVCITSPNPFHFKQVVTALEAGKHVLCEKPLAMTIGETQELVDLAATKPNKLALVNHQLRFNPYVLKVRELLHEGAVGRPYHLRVHQQSTAFADPNASWSWSFDADQGGGVRLAMGSHLIDLVRFWLGCEAQSVSGAMDPVISHRANGKGNSTRVRASSFFCASLGFPGGISVQLSSTAAAHSQARFEFSVYGETGELHFDLTSKLKGAFFGSRGTLEEIPVRLVSEPEKLNQVSIFSGSFSYFASRIVAALQADDWQDLDYAAQFRDSLHTQTVLDALLLAANSGRAQVLVKHLNENDYV